MDKEETLQALYEIWDIYNGKFFETELKRPTIEFGPTGAPNQDAIFRPGTAKDVPRYILRDSRITGTHPDMREGDEYWQGRARYVCDLMLRLMVLHWVQEHQGGPENTCRGYGPIFCKKANETGKEMGLEPVRTCNVDSESKKSWPVCSGWPQNRRPADYYEGAYQPKPRKRRLEKVKEMVNKLPSRELKELQSFIEAMIPQREELASESLKLHNEIIKLSGQRRS